MARSTSRPRRATRSGSGATDSGTPAESFARALAITATDANDAPTDVTLSPASITEDQPAHSAVGNLAAVDQDTADSHTFSLVTGSGDDDNASFEMTGSQLRSGGLHHVPRHLQRPGPGR